VIFAVGGGLLVLRWRRIAWLHVPALAWGVGVELAGRICPLTRLEDSLRGSVGVSGPNGDFVARTLSAVLYPANLTRADEVALGLGLLVLNAAVYAVVLRRALARARLSDSA
jgi:hypothetical protein